MFDKLKRIFIIEEEDSGKQKPKETTPSAPANQTSSSSSSPKSSSTFTSSKVGTPKEKFTNILFGAIEANDLEGFDYLEYKESLQSLAKMNMDEETRYKSAFAMAQTMGATPQKLVDSIVHYKNVLSKEEAKFDQALENQRAKQIHEEEKRVAQLRKNIEARKKQLEDIQSQIANDEKTLEDALAGLQGAEEKISATKANFVASYQSIVSQLDADIEKIKTFLK